MVEGLTAIPQLACVRQQCATEQQDITSMERQDGVSLDVVLVFIPPPSENKAPVSCQVLLNQDIVVGSDRFVSQTSTGSLTHPCCLQDWMLHIPSSFTHVCTRKSWKYRQKITNQLRKNRSLRRYFASCFSEGQGLEPTMHL